MKSNNEEILMKLSSYGLHTQKTDDKKILNH